MENTTTNGSVEKEQKKAINWVLILATLIIIAATFLTWYSDGLGRIGSASNSTLFDIGSGPLFSIFAALNLLFALLRKRIPTYLFSALLALLAVLQIQATISEIPYFFNFSFGAGFYLMIGGLVLLVVSHLLFSAIQKKQAGG